MKTTKITLIFLITISILIFISIGYMQGFEAGKKAQAKMDNMGTNPFIFECNEFSQPYYSCQNKFMNITGLYCNGKLVCENKLKGWAK